METGKQAQKGKWSAIQVGLVALAVLLLVLIVGLGAVGLYVAPQVIVAAKRARLQNEMVQVQTAVLSYYTEYSEYPVASDNASLIKMLDGTSSTGNSRQIAFISLKPSDQDERGEVLDPWGTPIELSVSADGKLHARSAGPDKIFGTADDITSQ